MAETWASRDEAVLASGRWRRDIVGYSERVFGPFTIGNSKLGPIPFYSLPPITTCPSATRFCRAYCYAIYEILDRRAHLREAASYILSLREDFPDIINWYLDKLRSRAPTRVVRLHVSGDFYSTEYVVKWYRVAEANPDYVFYTYTRSFKQVIEAGKPPGNLLIHLSADRYNLDEAVKAYNAIRSKIVTYVYTPGSKRDLGAIVRLVLETDAWVLVFRNHAPHAPRVKPDIRELRRELRKMAGPAADRVVFDPHEFWGGVTCLECGICWKKKG